MCFFFCVVALLSSGWAVLLGLVPKIEDPWVNFRQPFQGSITEPTAYAWGLYKTMNSFIGWNTASAVRSLFQIRERISPFQKLTMELLLSSVVI